MAGKRDLVLARLAFDIEANTKGLQGQLSDAERSFGRFTSFVTANPIAALGALAAAAVAAGLKAADMAEAFDGSARRIAAVLPGGIAKVEELKAAADSLAKSKGLSSEQVLAGFKGLASDVGSLDELVARFNIIQKAADATGEEFDTLRGGFDQVLDTFNLGEQDLQHVAATFAHLGQVGHVSMAELFAAFQAAVPAITAAGLSFDQAAGAIAGLVAHGRNAKQAASELKTTLEALGAGGLKQLPTTILDAAGSFDELNQRAAVVEQAANRIKKAIDESFQSQMRKVGESIRTNLTEPTLNFAKALAVVATGGSLGSNPILSVFQNAAGIPNGTAAPGPNRGGPVMLPDITVRELSPAEKSRAQAFADEVRRATVKATATMVDDLQLVLDEFSRKFRENAAGLTAAQLAEAQGQLDQLKRALQEVRQLEANPLTPRLATETGPLAIRRDTAKETAEQKEHILEVNKKLTEEEKKRAQIAQELKDRATQQATQLERAVRGAVQLGQAFGILDRQTASVLEGIGQVVSGIQEALAVGLNFSNALSIAGGFASVLTGLFGESPEAARDRQLREANTEAIRELTKVFSDQVTGATVGSASKGVDLLLQNQRALFNASYVGGFFSQGRLEKEANKLLAGTGLTLQDLQDQLAAINPKLKLNTDSFGNFIGTLGDMKKAIDAVQFAAFADSFAGKLSFLQVQLDLLDLTNPIDQLKALQNLASNESPIVKQLLGGLDLTTAQGRSEAEKQLLALLDKLNTKGALTGTDLGNLSPADLLDLIKQIEGLLDQVKNGTASTGQTTNFTSENRITETTGARLAGLAESQLAVQKDILAALTGGFTPVNPPVVAYAQAGMAGMSITIGNITVQFLGPVGDTATAAGQVAQLTADKLDRMLGSIVQQRLAQLGRV